MLAKILFFITLFFSFQLSAGMVSYFNSNTGKCPSGWKPATNAQGRLIKGTTNGNRVGLWNAQPMQNKKSPTHKHEIYIYYKPLAKTVVAAENFLGIKKNYGVANGSHNWYAHDSDQTNAFTKESDGNIPYAQMIVCEEVANQAPAKMPKESVAFFNNQSCPTNWAPYSKLNQRFLLPAPSNTRDGEFNQAVGSGTAQHMHKISMVEGIAGKNQVGINLQSIGMEASSKGVLIKESNKWAKNQSPIHIIHTKDHESNVPYVEYLPCKKTLGRSKTKDLPDQMMTFITAQNCPTGWYANPSYHGRFIVGLAANPQLRNSTFGGNPLDSMENRSHHHGVNYIFNWPSRGFVGFTGSSNMGFAKAGNYTINGTTHSAQMKLPYVQMRHCIIPDRNKVDTGDIKQ